MVREGALAEISSVMEELFLIFFVSGHAKYPERREE